MTWTTKTDTRWPRDPRDRPLLIAVAFFALIAAFFLSGWYRYYSRGMLGRALLYALGIGALFTPAFLTWRQASRAGRRRSLWSLLVLSGSALALFLPAQYLILSKQIPTSIHQVLPDVYSQALTATLVAAIPLAMGAIPIVLYGLAIGQARPLAGVPPRSAIVAVWLMGTVICTIGHLLAVLNPSLPPLISVARSEAVQLRIEAPPTVESEVLTATWRKLLWRLGDGFPPGTTVVSADRDDVRLAVPVFPGWEQRLAQLTSPGIVEVIYTGETRLSPDTEVSTSVRPLPDKSQTYETLFSSPDLQLIQHWSGIEFANVTVEPSDEGQAAVRFLLIESAVEELARSTEGVESENMALVLNNVVMASTMIPSGGSSDGFLVGGLSTHDAQLVAAVARYGVLPLVPVVTTGN